MKQRLRTGFYAAIMGALAGLPASAQSELHIEAWLDGDDAQSLAALADLADEGDFTAQVFLGQLDRDIVPGGASSYLMSVDEETRDGLLRRSLDDRRTENWLLALSDADKQSFGLLLFGYRVGNSPIKKAVALRENGEISAADYLLWATLMDGSFQALEAIPDRNFGLADNNMIVWLKEALADQDRVLNPTTLLANENPEQLAGLLVLDRMSSLLRVSAGQTRTVDQLITILKGRGSDLPDTTDPVVLDNLLNDLAQKDPRLSLLADLCANCEDEVIDLDCIREALEVIGGYRTLMKLRTPSDNVIPAAVFYSSDRASITLTDLLHAQLVSTRYEPQSTCLRGIKSE